jgi:hypothetical protein
MAEAKPLDGMERKNRHSLVPERTGGMTDALKGWGKVCKQNFIRQDET